MNPTIGIFLHHPEASRDCCEATINALLPNYNSIIFTEEQCNRSTLDTFDMVVFPGGIGDASSYDKFFRRRAANAVAEYVANRGKYLGICMGAYWAGSYYFDILDSVDAVQYIKRPQADVKRSYGTTAPVEWNGSREIMYFYDGCALIGDESKFKTIARYHNGDPMAIIQNNVGVIGCHPESQQYWFDGPYPSVLKQHWHGGRHHNLLLQFANELMKI